MGTLTLPPANLHSPERLRLNDLVCDQMGIWPHEKQKQVLSTNARFTYCVCARRFGKTYICPISMCQEFAWAQRTKPPPGQPSPWDAWVLAPTKENFSEIWNALLAYIPEDWFYSTPHETSHTIRLVGNENRPFGQIQLQSAKEYDSLVSKGLNYVHVAESQNVHEKAIENVLPMLNSSGRNGRAMFEGMPPNFMTHWFARNSQLAKQRTQEGSPYYMYLTGTYKDNPLLSDEEKAMIEGPFREQMREAAWRQMYLAEFNELAAFFANYAQCIKGEVLTKPVNGARYVAGMDLGKKHSPSVLFILDALLRQVVFMKDWNIDADWDIQIEDCKKLQEFWRFETLVVDSTGMGGDAVATWMEKADLPILRYVFNPKSREDLLHELSLSIDNKDVGYPRIPRLIDELQAFMPVPKPDGRVKLQAPPGFHDDAVMALALALVACDPPARFNLSEYKNYSYLNMGPAGQYETDEELDQMLEYDVVGTGTYGVN